MHCLRTNLYTSIILMHSIGKTVTHLLTVASVEPLYYGCTYILPFAGLREMVFPVCLHGYKMYISWQIIPWKYTTLMNNLMNKIASSHLHITWQYLRLYDMCDNLVLNYLLEIRGIQWNDKNSHINTDVPITSLPRLIWWCYDYALCQLRHLPGMGIPWALARRGSPGILLIITQVKQHDCIQISPCPYICGVQQIL